MAEMRKGLDPGMSYRRAINLYVTTEDGHRCSVGEVPPGAFAVLMLVALQTIPKESDRAAAAKAIADLDYAGKAGRIDRWFAMATIAEYGAALPLFRSCDVPDRDSHRKMGRSQEVEPMGSRDTSSYSHGIDTTVPYNLACHGACEGTNGW